MMRRADRRQSSPCYDIERELYYLRARYYDPTTAQFLTRDPAVEATRSPYAYVNGDPLDATDPTGLDGCGLNPFCYAAGAAGAVVGYASSLCVRNPLGGDNDNGGCHTTLSTSQGVAAAGVAIGVGATVASGGALLGAGAFGLDASGLALFGIGSGVTAGALDLPGCAAGDSVACLGLGLGLTGAAAGIPEVAGSLAGVEAGSVCDGALNGLSALGLHLGIAGTLADFAHLVGQGSTKP